MYSVRKTTVYHGTNQFHLLIVGLVITVTLTALFGTDYLVVYLSSGILLSIIEVGMALRGWRKSTVSVYGKKLSPFADGMMRAFIEAPGVGVPAFFMADQLIAQNYAVAIVGTTIVVAAVSFYSAITDRKTLRKLKENEEPIYSRRKMTRPAFVMTVALGDLICISSLFLMASPYQKHAFCFLFSLFYLTQLFFLINGALGVRMIQHYDHDKKEFYRASVPFSIVAFTYDSFFEMSLFNMIYYLIPYAFGLFRFATLI